MFNINDILLILTVLCNFSYNIVCMILNITVLKKNIPEKIIKPINYDNKVNTSSIENYQYNKSKILTDNTNIE